MRSFSAKVIELELYIAIMMMRIYRMYIDNPANQNINFNKGVLELISIYIA